MLPQVELLDLVELVMCTCSEMSFETIGLWLKNIIVLVYKATTTTTTS